jgi:hypothetical protein
MHIFHFCHKYFEDHGLKGVEQIANIEDDAFTMGMKV